MCYTFVAITHERVIHV